MLLTLLSLYVALGYERCGVLDDSNMTERNKKLRGLTRDNFLPGREGKNRKGESITSKVSDSNKINQLEPVLSRNWLLIPTPNTLHTYYGVTLGWDCETTANSSNKVFCPWLNR